MGVGRYKLKDSQANEAMGKTMLLAALNQLLERCHIYHNQMVFLKGVIVQSMAIRYGFKLPLHLMMQGEQ